MLRPLGLGPAVFIAIVVIALFICLGIAAGKLKGLTGVLGVLIFTALVFGAIFFWPTYQPGETLHKEEPIDYIFFPRILLLIFLVGVHIVVIQKCVQYYLLGGSLSSSQIRPRNSISSR